MREVTRAEFEMLRSAVAENARRLDGIDASGTRGVVVVQQQLTDLKGDVSELKVRLEKHESDHVTARRWFVGTLIAALAAIEAPLAYLISHVH